MVTDKGATSTSAIAGSIITTDARWFDPLLHKQKRYATPQSRQIRIAVKEPAGALGRWHEAYLSPRQAFFNPGAGLRKQVPRNISTIDIWTEVHLSYRSSTI